MILVNNLYYRVQLIEILLYSQCEKFRIPSHQIRPQMSNHQILLISRFFVSRSFFEFGKSTVAIMHYRNLQ